MEFFHLTQFLHDFFKERIYGIKKVLCVYELIVAARKGAFEDDMARGHIESPIRIEQLFVELLEDRAKLMSQNELLLQRKVNNGGYVVAVEVQQVAVLPKVAERK